MRYHHGGAELLVRAHVTVQAPGEIVGQGDAVALHGDIDIEAGLAQQEVAHGTAHQIGTADPCGHGLDLAQHAVQIQLSQGSGEVGSHGGFRLHRASATRHRRAGGGADDISTGPLRLPRIAHHRCPADLLLGDDRRHTIERRVCADHGNPRAHHRLDRGVPQAVGSGTLQVDQRDLAGQALAVGHQHTGEMAPAALQGGLVHRHGEAHRRRCRHEHIFHGAHRGQGGRHGAGHGRRDLVQRPVLHYGRGGGGVAAAAHHRQNLGHIQAVAAAPRGDEDPALHGHQQEEGIAAGEIHDAMRHHADAFHIQILAKGGNQHGGLSHGELLGGLQSRRQRVALRLRERVGEPLLEQRGVGATLHAQR